MTPDPAPARHGIRFEETLPWSRGPLASVIGDGSSRRARSWRAPASWAINMGDVRAVLLTHGAHRSRLWPAGLCQPL